MNDSASFPVPLKGSLQLYQQHPLPLPYFDTDPDLPNTLVFIPGLTNTIGCLPYLPRIAESIRKHGYSLVQPQMSCNLGGYGQSTLEGDAQEIAKCISHLRSLPSKLDGRIVLMGHSTGCQDVITYLLSHDRATNKQTRLDGAILQAPASDREYYEMERNKASPQQRAKMDRELQHAIKLVEEGQGATLMPRSDPETIHMPTKTWDADQGFQSGDTEQGNASAVFSPAMTAYRTWALKAKQGHDDLFSSDLTDDEITNHQPGAHTIARAITNLGAGSDPSKPTRMLALIGEKE
uniref:DUF1749-domain-containing protein n=1 Tax=Melanopsichium pennsylvanicum 4 TaxID=1398559 RepID=A0A077R789_9BASI|nr:conserved hypothetical protein [Melanopsichium pennsylvanicum 4]